jgi:hypothetical protein
VACPQPSSASMSFLPQHPSQKMRLRRTSACPLTCALDKQTGENLAFTSAIAANAKPDSYTNLELIKGVGLPTNTFGIWHNFRARIESKEGRQSVPWIEHRHQRGFFVHRHEYPLAAQFRRISLADVLIFLADVANLGDLQNQGVGRRPFGPASPQQ